MYIFVFKVYMRLRGPALGHLPHPHSLCDASLEHAAWQHAHRLGVVRGAGLAHDVGARGELATESRRAINLRLAVLGEPSLHVADRWGRHAGWRVPVLLAVTPHAEGGYR